MSVDLRALEEMNSGRSSHARLRFFQWNEPTVSFGYLMDELAVREWAPKKVQAVRRPTGGGAVLHQTTDLSFSILWPRGSGLFPDKPRAAYLAVHEKVKAALEKWQPNQPLSLFVSCASESRTRKTVSVCFNEPVCNDVMASSRKIVGGALRVMRNAILYQGNILLKADASLAALKTAIQKEFI